MNKRLLFLTTMVLVSAACNFSKAEEGPVSDAN